MLDLGLTCANRTEVGTGREEVQVSGFLGAPLGLIRDKGKLGSEAEMGGMLDLFRNRDGEWTKPGDLAHLHTGHVGRYLTAV